METQTLTFSAERITSLIMIRNVVIKTVCAVQGLSCSQTPVSLYGGSQCYQFLVCPSRESMHIQAMW